MRGWCGVVWALVRTDVRHAAPAADGAVEVAGCDAEDRGGLLKHFGGRKDRYAAERDFLQAAKEPDSPWHGKVLHLFRERQLRGAPAMELENLLCAGQKPLGEPFVLDLTLGTQTWREAMPASEIERLHRADEAHTTQLLGYRVASASLPQGPAGVGAALDGEDAWRNGRLRPGFEQGEDAERIIAAFFQGDARLLAAFAAQLGPITALLEEQREHRFVGTSLLVVYDNAAERKDETLKVRLIDFQHVAPLSSLVYRATLGDVLHATGTDGDRLRTALEVRDYRGGSVVLPVGTPIDKRALRVERPALGPGGDAAGQVEAFYPFGSAMRLPRTDPRWPCAFSPLVDVGVLRGLAALQRLAARLEDAARAATAVALDDQAVPQATKRPLSTELAVEVGAEKLTYAQVAKQAKSGDEYRPKQKRSRLEDKRSRQTVA